MSAVPASALRQYEYEPSSMPDDSGMGGDMCRVSDITIIDEARAKASALVDRETIRTGSRMAAYVAVASMVGVSPEWIRCFVNKYPNAKPDTILLNIAFQYERITKKQE